MKPPKNCSDLDLLLLPFFGQMDYNQTCEVNYVTGRGLPFLAVTAPQFVACMITVIQTLVFGYRFLCKNSYHSNAKIIICTGQIFVLSFCLYFMTTTGMHFKQVLFHASNPCSMVQTVHECTVFYYLHIFTLSGMSITQVFLSVERVISCLMAQKYEHYGGTIGAVFSICAVAFSAADTWFCLSDYDPSELRLSCLGVPFSARHRSIVLYIVVIVCDAVGIILFIYTAIRSKQKKIKGQYFLGKRYQDKENMRLVKVFIPITVAHFCCYVAYAGITAVLRFYVTEFDQHIYPVYAMGAMVIPYYTTIELSFLNWVITDKSKKIVKIDPVVTADDRTRAHFDELTKAWNLQK